MPEQATAGGNPEPFLTDLEMLVMTPGGRERTEEEYRALLAAAGYRLLRRVPTASVFSVVEAAPG